MLDFETSKSKFWVLEIKFLENCFFPKNYVTSEGAVSYNVLYYQQLPITCYQVRFNANNYFEQLPIISTANVQEFINNQQLISLKVYSLYQSTRIKVWLI